MLTVIALFAVAVILVIAGLLGCEKPKSTIRKYLEETGEMPRRETLEDVKVEFADESHIFCDGCCAKSIPGYRYCQEHLNKWAAGRTNAGDD